MHLQISSVATGSFTLHIILVLYFMLLLALEPFYFSALSLSIISTCSGSTHSCVVASNNKVKCWGGNQYGQLGLGLTVNMVGAAANEMGSNLPFVSLGNGLAANKIYCGEYSTCVIFTNGQAKCWGRNDDGRLGLGDKVSRGKSSSDLGNNLPVLNFGSGLTFDHFALGMAFACTKLSNAAIKCVGLNDWGQLGYGNTNDYGDSVSETGDSLPTVNLGSGLQVTSIHSSSTSRHICALFSTSKLKCWGRNSDAELGLGSTSDSYGTTSTTMGDSLPFVDVGTGKTVQQVTLGYAFTCALLSDSTVRCWGNGQYGIFAVGQTNFKLGDTPSEMGDNLSPASYGSSKTPVKIFSNGLSHCVILNTGDVKCYGYNYKGALGQGNSINYGYSPSTVGDYVPAINFGTSLPISTLMVGNYFFCAVIDNEKVKCFGSGEMGSIGSGSSQSIGDSVYEVGTNVSYIDIFSTKAPTNSPTLPTYQPSKNPSTSPTTKPSTHSPSNNPTINPSTSLPTKAPSKPPSNNPTKLPSIIPTNAPSLSPSPSPAKIPAVLPTKTPSKPPSNTISPTSSPKKNPTSNPTISPTSIPFQTLPPTTNTPSQNPLVLSTSSPSKSPINVVYSPTGSPFTSISPTTSPSKNSGNVALSVGLGVGLTILIIGIAIFIYLKFGNKNNKKYLAFLSHSKAENGAVATLIHDTAVVMLEKRRYRNQEIFLDSEVLTDLRTIPDAVQQSKVMVVLLSKSYLTRPWCLVELHFALEFNIPIVAINVTSGKYDFEEGKTFLRELNDERLNTINNGATAELSKLGINSADLGKRLFHVLPNIIAHNYNPLSPVRVREAEIGYIIDDIIEKANLKPSMI